MRNITIIGAGQSGLQLGIGLVPNGYRVRLVPDRKGEDIASGKVMSSQCMFDDALQSERDLGINDWEKQCPHRRSRRHHRRTRRRAQGDRWVYTLDRPGQAVDQRVKYPGWMKKFRTVAAR